MAILGFLCAAELLVRLQQRLQADASGCPRLVSVILLAEFLHRRHIVEQIGQRVGIAGARGRIGIVLHEVQRAVGQVGIQPRGDFQSLIAGIDRRQHLLRRQQFEARQQRRIREHHLLHAVDRARSAIRRS